MNTSFFLVSHKDKKEKVLFINDFIKDLLEDETARKTPFCSAIVVGFIIEQMINKGFPL